ncbi:protein of unknown function (plasmid) [Cupriavidus neocaledonicus]|uniref:Uncharacterized protein n=1 Tax=Cupriavidus neocaledonicus TaxID=1040979 RepID=A0A375HTP6_9BURK|nr:protein of unknown function [Cupriavidus neocaledonicus]
MHARACLAGSCSAPPTRGTLAWSRPRSLPWHSVSPWRRIAVRNDPLPPRRQGPRWQGAGPMAHDSAVAQIRMKCRLIACMIGLHRPRRFCKNWLPSPSMDAHGTRTGCIPRDCDMGLRPCDDSSYGSRGNPWTSRLRTGFRSSRSRAAAFAGCTRPSCLPISRRKSGRRLRPAST